ncbi:uncharacterized protein A1O5_08399 [Cladophialophora psammophila CBS 110553]|uniref:Uncharacterized protein n=1 Tax=Cladophialophora psammophila CBS 110553 TaxID=1182543 RepID=W9WU86_9EURO|nr:uncharacterized protein A1O5_08399 [Cladophialophora psammophila CBS 110553]EXJ68605.1 hypothetical protein A1O5_08399 [Cladophialophora psammophila CBS 110553]
MTAHKHPSLSGINATIADLRTLKSTLRNLKERCDEIPQELQLQLDVNAAGLRNQQIQFYLDAAKLSKQQHQLNLDAATQAERVARLNQQFSWMMLVFVSPIALAANFFSMDSKVIPFVKPNFGSFAALVVAFAGLGTAIQAVLSKWPKVVDPVQKFYSELVDTMSRLPRRARNVPGDEEDVNSTTPSSIPGTPESRPAYNKAEQDGDSGSECPRSTDLLLRPRGGVDPAAPD